MLNENEPSKILYNIENMLRQMSTLSNGFCYVFAVYDICRTSAAEIKDLIKQQKVVHNNQSSQDTKKEIGLPKQSDPKEEEEKDESMYNDLTGIVRGGTVKQGNSSAAM